MTPWSRVVGDRPIVTRLVVAVAATMTVVLLLAGAFVFWRVQYALSRQLDQDLKAYQQVVERAVTKGNQPPTETPGQTYQLYDKSGKVIGGNATIRLLDQATVTHTAPGEVVHGDVGNLIPPAEHPYRYVATQTSTPSGEVVVASAISRHKHDEALRELLLQLGIADLATLAAASIVGYRTARAALRPVERYRLAAEESDGLRLLPVVAGRDDEIARLGDTFNSLLERIRAASDRERQFLADASHELRSPLAVMRTELQMALRGQRSEAQTDVALRSLTDQVERLINLSNALLDLEELRGSQHIFHEDVDVEQLVEEVAARFSTQAQTAGRHLEARVVGAGTIAGNRHWLDLALGNLVSNALRYGTGTITITATRSQDETVLAVADEGPGMPPDFVHRAFDRFSRAEASRTSGGTGLGLALVQAVAEAHGGTAGIDSPRVELRLPATNKTDSGKDSLPAAERR